MLLRHELYGRVLTIWGQGGRPFDPQIQVWLMPRDTGDRSVSRIVSCQGKAASNRAQEFIMS